ncbi:TPA: hypothetical protein ACSP2W_003313, partial [Aeromonas veronii]
IISSLWPLRFIQSVGAEQGVFNPWPTLPPVDYSFQNAPLTSEGSSPSQMNRHRMAMLSQSNLVVPVKK